MTITNHQHNTGERSERGRLSARATPKGRHERSEGVKITNYQVSQPDSPLRASYVLRQHLKSLHRSGMSGTTQCAAHRGARSAFTLFEALVALGIFAIAFTGLVVALESGVRAGIEARRVATMRHELESRLAYCLVDTPIAGAARVIEADDNRGFRVEEAIEPYTATALDGTALEGFWTLTIKIESAMQGITTSAETLIYKP